MPPQNANLIGLVDECPVPCAAADVHAPAANTAAVVTYAAVPGLRHVISGIGWSYGVADPVGGNLKVEDVAGTEVFSMDITTKGAGIVQFPKPKKSAAAGTALIVTLAAGGGTSVAKVSVLNHWLES